MSDNSDRCLLISGQVRALPFTVNWVGLYIGLFGQTSRKTTGTTYLSLILSPAQILNRPKT